MSLPKVVELRRLRIAVAEDEVDMLAYYKAVLPILGHQVVATARNGVELVQACQAVKPDLVIADIAMPVMDGIQAAEEICKAEPVAFILVSAHYDRRLIVRAQLDYVMAYLVKPVTEVDLETSIAIAMQRFEQFKAVCEDARSLRQALHDRKAIERAKGIIMQGADLNEADAFRQLQKMAWDRNKKLIDVAQSIITAATAINLSDAAETE